MTVLVVTTTHPAASLHDADLVLTTLHAVTEQLLAAGL
jgi:hypothetical protein